MGEIDIGISIVCLILAGLYAAPLVLWGLGLRRLLRREPHRELSSTRKKRARPDSRLAWPFVSVIVAARNEQSNIIACLEALLKLDYPIDRYEILIVDDGSEDETVHLVNKYMVNNDIHDRIEVLESAPFTMAGGKKAALTRGIRTAHSNILALTDADCTVPTRWLTAMLEELTEEVGLVSGPVMYAPKTSFFQRALSLEFAGFTGIAAGAIELGLPVSCSGASLLVRRAAFDRVGGYTTHASLASGDDELLMQHIHADGRYRIATCADPEAKVITQPPTTFRQFLDQRIRWASKRGMYQDAWLKSLHRSAIMFMIVLVAVTFLSLARPELIPVALGMWALKVGFERLVLVPTVAFQNHPVSLRYHVLSQPFQLGYLAVVVAVVLSRAVRNGARKVAYSESSPGAFSWKGRSISS